MELFVPKNAEVVVRNNKFAIASLFIRNDFGSISWTIHYIYLNPNSYTDPFTIPVSKSGTVHKALYTLQKGKLTLFVDDIPTQIKAGQMFCIVQGQKHLFFNASEEQAVIVMQYPSLFRFNKKLEKTKGIEINKKVMEELDPSSAASSS